jgi:DNA replication protein DnaC
MPYTKKKRPYKKEYQQQKARGEHANRMERQKARRKMDATSPDKNKNGKADKREGKDVSHKKALSKGGKNSDGVRIESKAKNRSRNYKKKKKNKK